MEVSLPVLLVLLAAGVLAGVVGTAGGITSLVTYPALLAVGVAPLEANVVNLVAVVACWPGSAWASRRELEGTGGWLARGLPVAAVGAGAGSLLLLCTPPGMFARVVPLLVALGCVALLLSPALVRLRGDAGRARSARPGALAGVGVVSVYGGYFGAGSGIMLLTLALVLVDPATPTANAVKNMLVGANGLASGVVLVVAGPVEWAATLPLAVGLLAGSTLGPAVARHVPAGPLRWVVAALGLVLAVDLGLRAW